MKPRRTTSGQAAILTEGRRLCRGGCGFAPYRPAEVPDEAVFCMDCDHDNARRNAVLDALIPSFFGETVDIPPPNG